LHVTVGVNAPGLRHKTSMRTPPVKKEAPNPRVENKACRVSALKMIISLEEIFKYMD